ncbi:MAG: exosortase-associated EpsI family protein [Verrucomicrobia bacterium]|nr:exosortase-associated EpsI family protein [Verrucomicrobiota bacterium]
MNKQKWIVLILALGLMGSGAALLANLRTNQKLGHPAVKTSPIPGSPRLQVDLPERVPGYTSGVVEVDKATLTWLPQDTSFGRRTYRAPDGFEAFVDVVLMGSDRTSLHKTEFCLEGQGWKIDRNESHEITVPLDRPYAYELQVMKFIVTREVTDQGRSLTVRGVYLVWFVADGDEYTPRHWQRMWWMARDLLTTGVLQRWAMISYFTVCPAGQEEAAFERLKKFINASAPEFQLVPRPAGRAVAKQP